MNTKILGTIFLLVLSVMIGHAQKIIFLHHSTGGGVYSGGDVLKWIQTYNTKNGTAYKITERNYPDTPYPWENYPYDYWNLWINGGCNNSNSSIECMDLLTKNYDVIIFKHCFPGADVSADTGNESVSSKRKSIGNYKLQYRALRTLMDSYPTTKFIVWTLAPLHRNATTTENALRANQFVDWVKNEWLSEDNKLHPNIFIFDFYGLSVELNSMPQNGKINCLKYDYEGDHNGSDSHPNSLANRTVGPLFAQAIVDAIKQQNTSIYEPRSNEPEIRIYPNPTSDQIIIDLGKYYQTFYSPTVKIINSLNQYIYESQLSSPSSTIDLKRNLANGIYLVQFVDKDNNILHTQKIIIQ
jgi:hypothetical protein